MTATVAAGREADGGAAGRLAGRFVGLGITGSIAAFKAVDLLRLLRAEGAEVQVLMTPSAVRFVAPATAHWLGAMANGLPADVVTATCLATRAPVVVAPAMDGEMYAHPATQANVERLRSFGYWIVDPISGPLASGQVGPGRLAELGEIVDAVVAAVGDAAVRAADPAQRPPLLATIPHEADLDGRHVVVTAGGTAEPIDPVRFIGNRSSGRMGVAVAEAARDRGARVTLVCAAVSVALPEAVSVVRVETAAEMGAALDSLVAAPGERAGFDALVMAAAVADFRPAEPATAKIRRTDAGLTLRLVPNPDILAGIADRAARLAPRPVLVGFAAETGSLAGAGAKLAAKGLDLLVANDVSEPGSGFGTDTNRVTILAADGSSDALPLLPKREVADRVLDRVAAALDARDAAAQTGAGTGPRLPAGEAGLATDARPDDPAEEEARP